MKKLKFTNIIAGLLVAGSLITVIPLEAQAETISGQEKSDDKGAWVNTRNNYTYDSKYKMGDSWATGWKKIDGKWYYFYSDGTQARATPESSWVQIDGKWYSFNANGVMRYNSIIVDYPNEYYVGADGILAEMPTSGWVRNGQNMYYDTWRYRENNSWVTGWKEIEGKWYYFYQSGEMMTNSTKDGYHAGKDGVCVPI